jgi:hypothetical protein
VSFVPYDIDGVVTVFAGNTDQGTVVKQVLQRPLKGIRALRLQPQSNSGVGTALRVDVFGCVEDAAQDAGAADIDFVGSTPRLLSATTTAIQLDVRVNGLSSANVYAIAVPKLSMEANYVPPTAQQVAAGQDNTGGMALLTAQTVVEPNAAGILTFGTGVTPGSSCESSCFL